MVFSELQADFPMGAKSTLCFSLTRKNLTGQGKPLLLLGGKYFAALATHGISVEIQQMIRQRMELRRDAYLTKAGHKRPGIRAGLPVDEAEAKAETLSSTIIDR